MKSICKIAQVHAGLTKLRKVTSQKSQMIHMFAIQRKKVVTCMEYDE